MASRDMQIVDELRQDLIQSCSNAARDFWLSSDGTDMCAQMLRARNFDKRRALTTAMNFTRFREKQGWSLLITAKQVENPLRSGFHWLLPGYDNQGRRVIVYNLRNMDQSAGSIKQYQQMGCYIMQEATRRDPQAQTNGIVLVADCSHLKMSLFSVADFKRGTQMILDCFPVKVKAIYLCNLPRVASVLLTVLKEVVTKKMGERIHVVPKGGLNGYIKKENLPVSLGGSMPHFNWDEWVDHQLDAEAELVFPCFEAPLHSAPPLLSQRHHDRWINGSRMALPVGNTSVC
jgi:hypothetical protein